jgi:hypothetical protein
MPILNTNISDPNKQKQYQTYSTSSTFYGGDGKGPWSGFSTNIDKESQLRNQNYALQKDSLGTYIPSSQSDLYNLTWKNNNNYNKEEDKFFNSDIFIPPKQSSFNPNLYSEDVGYALFNNSTRIQNKDVKSNLL